VKSVPASNYHWPNDTPENLTQDTIRDAVLLAEVLARGLDRQSDQTATPPGLRPSAGAPR
jgi:hypothetical protein